MKMYAVKSGKVSLKLITAKNVTPEDLPSTKVADVLGRLTLKPLQSSDHFIVLHLLLMTEKHRQPTQYPLLCIIFN